MALPQRRPSGSFSIQTRSAEESRRVGAALSPILLPGDVLAIAGDLGVGKTTFVQGLAAGLGVTDRVTSPTFILMREYTGRRYPLLHMDVYRLDRFQEVVDLGYEEFLDPSHIVVVEWGDVIEPLLPKEHLLVEMAYEDSSARSLTMVPHGALWDTRMDTVRMLAGELFALEREAEEWERD